MLLLGSCVYVPWVYVPVKGADLMSHTQALFSVALKSIFKLAMGVGGGWDSSQAASTEDELFKWPCTSLRKRASRPPSGCTPLSALTFPQNALFPPALSWCEGETGPWQRQLTQTQAMTPLQETANTVPLRLRTHL